MSDREAAARLELRVSGLDCPDCAKHVRDALTRVPGVQSVEVFISTGKAAVRLDPGRTTVDALRRAIEGAGYGVIPDTKEPAGGAQSAPAEASPLAGFHRRVLGLLGLVFGAVLFVVLIGEWLGVFAAVTARVPWPVGLAIVLVGGYPVFRKVVLATLRGQVVSHTLMTLGALAALAVGQWATAVVVVFFMRVGDYAEQFTAERARRAVKDLTALAPRTARVERGGEEAEVPVQEVRPGEVVVVRPGEKIPVDGEIVAGRATIDQSSVTGESMPVEVRTGSSVFAATIALLGSLRVRATHVGADTTFGRVIKLVEEAEGSRADVQRIADKFSAYYLPVVSLLALLTLLLRRDTLSASAVLVVACSCSFALATPIAMLATIGAGAKRGLLIKGGKYLEALARADVLLLDKTGTLTLGRPRLTDVVPVGKWRESELLSLAASAERYSEHPLAEAVRTAAKERGVPVEEPEGFESLPGQGVRARVGGVSVSVGSSRMASGFGSLPVAEELERQGKTLLLVACDGEAAGVLAAADTVRSDVPAALDAIRGLGIEQIELLTGDNERTAAALAGELGVAFRANLLPDQKIAIVKEYQAKGRTVVMVGDGVNDAPALAQADVGIAMGAAGSDVAIEAAHLALLREDWNLVPAALRGARRTMGVVKMNIAFTALYNVVGLSLAALGFLPPILAAAAQSLPDLGILANSSRLLRQGKPSGSEAPKAGAAVGSPVMAKLAVEPCASPQCSGST
ncbi:MAG: cadmium-translocating P-type ATPase [Deltaproteobacteria bacterium]|nr:cadmium-translocating P-type ATPase [Deltaproteobacteria bacterium]